MRTRILDIAKKAKVSSMTVSRVLNNSGPVAAETRDLINKIVKELNYQPDLVAKSLSSRKTMTLGVIVPRTEQLFFDNYVAQITSGIADAAYENGYRILLVPIDKSSEDDSIYVNYTKRSLFDGMIILKAKSDDPYLNQLAESGFPFVLVNCNLKNDSYNYVDTENIKGTETAIEYLISKGHKKIAFVAGSEKETNASDRFVGYKNALKKHNIEFRKDYVINGQFEQRVAFEKSKALLELEDRPTAVFCSDDYMAFGVIDQIKSSGLSVPKDIAIIGFDNIEVSKFTKPSLTTIAQPMYKIGKSSVDVLMGLISKKYSPPVRKTLDTELIIRESV